MGNNNFECTFLNMLQFIDQEFGKEVCQTGQAFSKTGLIKLQ